MEAYPRFLSSSPFLRRTPFRLLVLALLGPAGAAPEPPLSPGPPAPAERARQPASPYDRNPKLLVDAAIGGARPANLTVFPGRAWEIASPESQGVDAAKLHAAVALLASTVGRDGTRELAVVRHGRLIWSGDDIDKMHGVWSFTKSFTSTALGLLIDDGRCTLDTKAQNVLPAMAAVYPEVTLRHFATMTSGYRATGDEPQGSYAHGPSVTPFTPGPEPLFTPPGSHFAYWDSAMNQFANVLTHIAGESLEELFQRRIADPIGMNRQQWDWGDWKQIDGLVVNGGSGNKSGALKISAREAARFGLLFLNRGRWRDRQLLSARWVDEATRVQVPADMPHGFPLRATGGPGEYGFNWWINGVKPDGTRKFPGAPPRTYCAAGHNNNLCFVIPEWDMVIVRLGLDGSAGDKVWNDFLAQVGEAIAPETRE
jgi:CubicO group peptidase (beta-lactamase class C family)